MRCDHRACSHLIAFEKQLIIACRCWLICGFMPDTFSASRVMKWNGNNWKQARAQLHGVVISEQRQNNEKEEKKKCENEKLMFTTNGVKTRKRAWCQSGWQGEKKVKKQTSPSSEWCENEWNLTSQGALKLYRYSHSDGIMTLVAYTNDNERDINKQKQNWKLFTSWGLTILFFSADAEGENKKRKVLQPVWVFARSPWRRWRRRRV